MAKENYTKLTSVKKSYTIKPNSFRARIASWVLREKKIAMVWSTIILLHGVSEDDFSSNKKWLRHELKHVEQFQQYGTLVFLWLYLLESIRKGYKNNKYELEARKAEE